MISIFLVCTLTVALLAIGNLIIVFQKENHYLTGEYLISADTETEAKTLAKNYGASFVRFSNNGFAVINFSTPTYVKNTSELSVNHTYKTLGEISEYTPNDTHFSNQYYLDMIDCRYAWNTTKGNQNVVVAVLDTGFNINHEDFPANVSELSCNIITGETLKEHGASAIEDNDGHGTAMAGIIAASQNNFKGISGIATDVTLLCIKIESPDGEIYLDDYIDAIYYAINNGAKIINISLGRVFSDGADAAELKAINSAAKSNVVVVCSAGNESQNHCCYPAAYSSTISVTAVDRSYAFAKSYSNYGVEATVAAPGTKILTLNNNGKYTYSTGTSPATAQVSGIIALMLSSKKYNTLSEIKIGLTNGAINPDGSSFSNKYGYGIVNAYNCLADEFYSVKFDAKTSETDLPSYSVAYGEEIVCPINNPIISGSEFLGWYQDEECTIPWVFKGKENAIKITDDTIIYSKWENNNSDISSTSTTTSLSNTTTTVSSSTTTSSSATCS